MLEAASLRPQTAAERPHPADRTESLPAQVARVEVHRDPAAALETWRCLEADASISPYQTRRWLLPWIESTGRAAGVSPFLVVAYDIDDAPLALLPLGVWRNGFVNVCGFLGGKDSNFNLGLFRPGTHWTRAEISALLRTASATGDAGIDVFVLRNQPLQWNGTSNPLARLPRQPSPSFGYKVMLERDPEDHFRRTLSRGCRRKLRQKTAHMQTIGRVEHRRACTAAEAHAVLDAFVEQRRTRSTALGLSTADLPEQRAFLERAFGSPNREPAVELHALFCGERILATFGGATHANRFCGMVMSFDSDPKFFKMSPGEILLAALIQSKCEAGFTTFDLGIGEARYKTTYCPDPEPLFDALLAMSTKGRLFAAAEAMRLLAKRSIRQSAWAWKTVQVLRRSRRIRLSQDHPDRMGAARPEN